MAALRFHVLMLVVGVLSIRATHLYKVFHKRGS